MVVIFHRFCFSCLELLLLWLYMASFKDTKIKLNSKYISLTIILSIVCTLATLLDNKHIDLIMIIVSCVAMALSIPSIAKYKVGMVISFMAIGMLVQFEIWSLYEAFPSFGLFANDTKFILQRSLFFAAQAFTIIVLSFVYGNQKICLKDLSEGILLAIGFYSMFSLAVCGLVWKIARYLMMKEVYYACLLIVFLSIINFYIFLFLIMNISKGIKDMLIKQRTIMVLEERGRFIDEVNDKCEFILKLKHNLKHRIIALWQAFETGEKEEIRGRLREIQVEVDEIDQNIYTQNIQVNSLLRYEFGKAKHNNITVNYKIELPAYFSLKDDDLCVLLGNILDNAIEACLKLDCEKRFINFTCKIVNKMLVVKAENSKLPESVVIFKTSKKNEKGHGYGMKSIDAISRSYEGECIFRDKKETFLVLSRLNATPYLI